MHGDGYGDGRGGQQGPAAEGQDREHGQRDQHQAGQGDEGQEGTGGEPAGTDYWALMIRLLGADDPVSAR